MRRSAAAVLAATLATVAWAAAPAGAAAPRLLMVSGGALPAPVLVSDWNDIFRLVQAVNEAPAVPRDSVAGRPYLRLSLFWDATIWEPYVREGRLGSLTPEDANQFGGCIRASKDIRPSSTCRGPDGGQSGSTAPRARFSSATACRYGSSPDRPGIHGRGSPAGREQ